MKIAILIGVSSYYSQNDLPGCAKDIEAVNKVLEKSKNYDLIKCFEDAVTGSKTKSDLTTLFSSLKDENVEELFFYFTGHGLYHQDDFYYMLSDYDDNKRRQTSLQNSEVDNWIKNINPQLVVKVIDACQSGITYIKGDDQVIEKYYKGTSTGFSKCYFMHSSMTDQYSYQDQELSDFTKSFLRAIKYCQKKEIRYKDIIDYISDEFEGITRQTPFFITQADFTELFLSCSQTIKQVIGKYVVETSVSPKPEKLPETFNETKLIDIIKSDAGLYATEEEAKLLLTAFKTRLEDTTVNAALAEAYDKGIYAESINDLPNRKFIGNWIKENPADYFAAPEYDEVPYQEENDSGFGLSLAHMMRRNTTVTKYRKVLVGYDLTTNVPFKSLYITLRPKFPNLLYYTCVLAFILSKKEIKLFYAYTSYIERSWTHRDINSSFNWNSKSFLIKEEGMVLDFATEILNGFSKFVLETIKKKFEPKS